MIVLKHTKKIREYCDYIDEHILNVKKAWDLVYEKCKDMHPFYDDFLYAFMCLEIEEHDLSKISPEEFIQYQQYFFSVENEKVPDKVNNFKKAWSNHLSENPHHWQSWTKRKESFPNENACHCIMMVCDWVAMGFKFEDNAKNYYEKEKETIDLPDWADKLVCDILDRVY